MEDGFYSLRNGEGKVTSLVDWMSTGPTLFEKDERVEHPSVEVFQRPTLNFAKNAKFRMGHSLVLIHPLRDDPAFGIGSIPRILSEVLRKRGSAGGNLPVRRPEIPRQYGQDEEQPRGD